MKLTDSILQKLQILYNVDEKTVKEYANKVSNLSELEGIFSEEVNQCSRDYVNGNNLFEGDSAFCSADNVGDSYSLSVNNTQAWNNFAAEAAGEYTAKTSSNNEFDWLFLEENNPFTSDFAGDKPFADNGIPFDTEDIGDLYTLRAGANNQSAININNSKQSTGTRLNKTQPKQREDKRYRVLDKKAANALQKREQEQEKAQDVANSAQVILDRKTGSRTVNDQEYAEALINIAEAMSVKDKKGSALDKFMDANQYKADKDGNLINAQGKIVSSREIVAGLEKFVTGLDKPKSKAGGAYNAALNSVAAVINNDTTKTKQLNSDISALQGEIAQNEQELELTKQMLAEISEGQTEVGAKKSSAGLADNIAAIFGGAYRGDEKALNAQKKALSKALASGKSNDFVKAYQKFYGENEVVMLNGKVVDPSELSAEELEKCETTTINKLVKSGNTDAVKLQAAIDGKNAVKSTNVAKSLTEGVYTVNGKELSMESVTDALMLQAEQLEKDFDAMYKDQGIISKGLGFLNRITSFGTSDTEARAQIETYKANVEKLKNTSNPQEFAALYKSITGSNFDENAIASLVAYSDIKSGESNSAKTFEANTGANNGKIEIGSYVDTLKEYAGNNAELLNVTGNSEAVEKMSDYLRTQESVKSISIGIATGVAAAACVIAAPFTGGASIALGAAVCGASRVALEGIDTIGTSKKYTLEKGALDFAGGAIDGAVTAMTLGTAGLASKGFGAIAAGKATASNAGKITLKQAYHCFGKSALNASRTALVSSTAIYLKDTVGTNLLYEATGNYSVAEKPSQVVKNDDGTYSVYYAVSDSNTGNQLYYQIETVDNVTQDENGNLIKGNVLSSEKSSSFSLGKLAEQQAISIISATAGAAIGKFTGGYVHSNVADKVGSDVLGNVAEIASDAALSMGADYAIADAQSLAKTGQHIDKDDFFNWNRIVGEGRNQLRSLFIGLATSKLNNSMATGDVIIENGIPKGTPDASGTRAIDGDSSDTRVIDTETPRALGSGEDTSRTVDTETTTPKALGSGEDTPRTVETETTTPKTVGSDDDTPRTVETETTSSKTVGSGEDTQRTVDTEATVEKTDDTDLDTSSQTVKNTDAQTEKLVESEAAQSGEVESIQSVKAQSVDSADNGESFIEPTSKYANQPRAQLEEAMQKVINKEIWTPVTIEALKDISTDRLAYGLELADRGMGISDIEFILRSPDDTLRGIQSDIAELVAKHPDVEGSAIGSLMKLPLDDYQLAIGLMDKNVSGNDAADILRESRQYDSQTHEVISVATGKQRAEIASKLIDAGIDTKYVLMIADNVKTENADGSSSVVDLETRANLAIELHKLGVPPEHLGSLTSASTTYVDGKEIFASGPVQKSELAVELIKMGTPAEQVEGILSIKMNNDMNNIAATPVQRGEWAKQIIENGVSPSKVSGIIMGLDTEVQAERYIRLQEAGVQEQYCMNVAKFEDEQFDRFMELKSDGVDDFTATAVGQYSQKQFDVFKQFREMGMQDVWAKNLSGLDDASIEIATKGVANLVNKNCTPTNAAKILLLQNSIKTLDTSSSLKQKMDVINAAATFGDAEYEILSRNFGFDVKARINEVNDSILHLIKPTEVSREDMSSAFQGFFNNKKANKSDSLGIVESVIAGADFTKFGKDGMTLEHSRSEFVENMRTITQDLSADEAQKIFQTLNITPVYDEAGVLKGYDGIINTEAAKTLVESGGASDAMKSALDKAEQFTVGNRVVIEDNPELSEAVNSLLKGFPEFVNVIGKQQHAGQELSVDAHIMKVLSAAVSNENYASLSDSDKTVLKLAIIFHDIAKPEGVNDKTHADYSAKYTKDLLEKVNLPQAMKDRVYELVKNHHWLEGYNTSAIDADTVAVMTRRTGDYEIMKIMADADLQGVSASHYSQYKGALADDVQAPILASKDRINGTGQLLFTDRIYNKAKVPTVTKDGVQYRVIDFAHMSPDTDLGDYGFVPGTKASDLRLLVHMTDADGMSTVARVQDVSQEGVLCTSYISLGAKTTYQDRQFGLSMEAENINVANAAPSNQYSGFGASKNFDNFANSVAKDGMEGKVDLLGLSNGGKPTPYRVALANGVKQELGLTDSQYAELYEQISGKHAISQIKDNAEFTAGGVKISGEKLKAAIRSADDTILSRNTHSEINVYDPKINAVVAKVDSLDEVPADILQRAQELGVPIYLLGKN